MRHRLGRSWCYRGAASRGRRGQDPCPAAPAMSARARSSAAGRGAGRDRRHHFTFARRRARSLRNRARHGWIAVIRPPRLRGRTHDRARRDARLTARSRPGSAPGTWRGRWVKRSGATHSRSSCPATACSRPVGRREGSPPMGGSRRSCACSRSNARARAIRLRYSMATARSALQCGPGAATRAERGGGARVASLGVTIHIDGVRAITSLLVRWWKVLQALA